MLTLSTVTAEELECLITGMGFPKYRAAQIYHWIRVKGVTDVASMNNIPTAVKDALLQYTKPTALTLLVEQVSRADGTVKRAYACHDGAVIESVLMGPYKNGRYTACISSQAGCAQGCVFCATGQMGFTRQLSDSEILEQVSRFASDLLQQQQQHDHHTHIHDPAEDDDHDDDGDRNTTTKLSSNNNNNKKKQQHGKSKRLSNVVFMGMGTYV
jgi:23S rRNA (adenine2503-C2)-methyltransferase